MARKRPRYRIDPTPSALRRTPQGRLAVLFGMLVALGLMIHVARQRDTWRWVEDLPPRKGVPPALQVQAGPPEAQDAGPKVVAGTYLPMPGPTDFGRVLMKRILVKGFIVIDYFPRAAEGFGELGRLVAEGKLKWKDHVVDGLENAADAVKRLFTGDHDGKLMIRVSPEP